MSYLTLANGIPDFSKAVISLWFRAPKESVVAASDHKIETGVEGWPVLQNVLPLITFGVPQKNQNLIVRTENIARGWPPDEAPYYAAVDWVPAPGGPADVDPCYIGLLCDNDGTFRVDITIQMGNHGFYSGIIWFSTSYTYIGPITSEPAVGSGITAAGQWEIVDETADGITNKQPEYFNVRTSPYLQPDQWHHLLLSFDVSGSIVAGDTVSSGCKLWYAIDDEDYRGYENLQPFRDSDDGLGENEIMTSNIYSNYGPQTDFLYQNTYIPHYVATYDPTPIPSSGAELGIPAAVKYVEGIFRVEMAEFQMWTGVTLDTGNELSRRAFVDAAGKPVNPKGTEDKPARAVVLLGKKPEILLHGNKNWKVGRNTGTLGDQFNPTAKIEKYKPEPKLVKTPTS